MSDIAQYYKDLKAKADIFQIASGRLSIPGLKRHGNYAAGPCPTGHGSQGGQCFTLYQASDGGRYHCHHCGASGDVVDLVELVLGLSSDEARDLVAVEVGMDLLKEMSAEDRRQCQAQKAAADRQERILSIFTHHCATRLWEPEQADVLDWVRKNWGLTDETIKKASIGWASASDLSWMRGQDLDGTKRYSNATEQELIDAGLAVRSKDSGKLRAWYNNRLIIPYSIIAGRTLYLTGRSCPLSGHETPEWDKPTEIKYRNPLNVERRPYNEVPKGDGTTLCIVEGQLDCLAVAQTGLPCVGLAGAQLTGRWGEWLSRLASRYSQIVILADSDDNGAGTAGALKTSRRLEQLGIQAGVAEVPRAEGQTKADPASWLLGVHAEERCGAVERLIETARTALIIDMEALPQQGSAGWDKALEEYLPRLSHLSKLERERYQSLVQAQVGLSVQSLRQAVRAAQRQTSGSGERSAHPSDWGNAQRLVQLHGPDLRHCDWFGAWYVWTGSHWERDETQEVYRRAKATVRTLHEEACSIEDDELRTKALRHAVASEGQGRIEAMLASASSEPGIFVRHSELDAQPWMLACQNGTLDLKTCAFREARREDYLTRALPWAFAPAATCPEWERALAIYFRDDFELIRFIQKAIGYSLTGDTSQKIIIILHGSGDNGKSIFVTTLARLFGPLALRTTTDTLLAKRAGQGSGIPNDIARLKGARFVYASETGEGQRLNEELIKDLTGGDTISARFLHGEFFEFSPTCHIWMESNHKPEIRGTDPAIWRRIRLVPFDVDVPKVLGPGNRQRWQVEADLLAEMPGILAWAVRGLQLYLQEGLGAPAAVADATAEYRQESDDVAAWMADCCLVAPYAIATSGALYASWKAWCEQTGAYCISQKKFAQKLKEKGFKDGRKGSGSQTARTWNGIGLLDKDSSATHATHATDRWESYNGGNQRDYSSATHATDATDYSTRAHASASGAYARACPDDDLTRARADDVSHVSHVSHV